MKHVTRRFFDWLANRTVGRLLRYMDRGRVYYPHGVTGGRVMIGEGTILEAGVRIDGSGRVNIVRNCYFSHKARVLSHSHSYLKGDVPNINAAVGTVTHAVEIGDNVFVGEEAVILPQAGVIGESAVIGVRAVVTKPVGPGEIWAGNPALKVGHRGEERTGNPATGDGP
jgi:acetyltransferase-like isoleucine patch superfamily enzyme